MADATEGDEEASKAMGSYGETKTAIVDGHHKELFERRTKPKLEQKLNGRTGNRVGVVWSRRNEHR
jgi:hypothetical protein